MIGSGFGGLFAAKALRGAPVRVTMVDRTNHHLFQPLLYQVATGILSEGQIAPPSREVFRRYRSMEIVMGEVTEVDAAAHEVRLNEFGVPAAISYDSLIVAAGAVTSYFGNEKFRENSSSLKSLRDALDLRERIFAAFERAEVE
ncbi:MAG: NAD(P)/FAD-dependent oxidoreductase, partial [Nitrososphaerales archaeon]